MISRHRRSIRLPEYDYRSAGAYFVTICSHQRAILFDVPAIKRAVELAFLSLGRYCRPASADVFVVMPNHVHAVIWITGNDRMPVRGVGAQHKGQRTVISPTDDHWQGKELAVAACAAPLRMRRVTPGSLGAVVRAFKSATTKRVNAIRGTVGAPVWQRNYYEHVVRSNEELSRIRLYIRDNPLRWVDDPDNPANFPDAPTTPHSAK